MDVVLKNGFLLDGTGGVGDICDLGVRDGRVAAIAPPGRLTGAEVVDVSGHVVCPGFLDTHTHTDLAALRDPDVAMKARQGVTLDVLGQDGVGVAPLPRDKRAQMARTLAGLDGTLEDWDWETVGEYASRLTRTPAAINLAILVPHGNVRLACLGMDDRPATSAEIVAMQDMLAQSLEAGAIGLSTGLIYPPCCYAPTEELVELGRVLAKYDRPVVEIGRAHV